MSDNASPKIPRLETRSNTDVEPLMEQRVDRITGQQPILASHGATQPRREGRKPVTAEISAGMPTIQLTATTRPGSPSTSSPPPHQRKRPTTNEVTPLFFAPNHQCSERQRREKRGRQINPGRLAQVLDEWHAIEQRRRCPSHGSRPQSPRHPKAANAPSKPNSQCNSFAAISEVIVVASRYNISVSCGRFE